MAGTVVNGHSAINQAGDRFIIKTGYSPMGGNEFAVKDCVRRALKLASTHVAKQARYLR